MKTEILIATANKHKLDEIRQICVELPVLFTALSDYWQPVPVIDETGQTFEENALQKARWVWEHRQGWVMADDSGLEVDVLQGLPGVHSARFTGAHGNDRLNLEMLLEQLRNVNHPLRTARFRCVIALIDPAGQQRFFNGVCEGHIALSSHGSGGFGYDPVFVPVGFSETFGQLDVEVKNRLSHRAAALKAMHEELYAILHP